MIPDLVIIHLAIVILALVVKLLVANRLETFIADSTELVGVMLHDLEYLSWLDGHIDHVLMNSRMFKKMNEQGFIC